MGESRGGGGSEDTKLRLHGLFTQVKNGPADQDLQPQQKLVDKSGDCGKDEFSPLSQNGSSASKSGLLSNPLLVPSEGINTFGSSPRTAIGRSRSAERGQLEAWRDCGSMSQEDAMRAFLCVLFSSAPYWKYEQFI